MIVRSGPRKLSRRACRHMDGTAGSTAQKVSCMSEYYRFKHSCKRLSRRWDIRTRILRQRWLLESSRCRRPPAMVGKKRQEPPVEVEEGDFPRGGRQDLTPLEKRQLSQQAEADFKQEQAAGASGSSQRKRAKHAKDKDGDFEGAMFSSAAVSGKAQHVEQLKYKTLCVGMKLWGCVLEVSPESLTVSLPHGLRGTVAPKDTSDILAAMLDPVSKKGAALRAALPKGLGGDPQQQQGVPGLDQLFSVGQYVRCVVKELEAGGGDDVETAAADAGAGGSRKAKSSKRIILSLKLKSLLGAAAAAGGSAAAMGLVPGQVVPAAVKSVEDRGYSLSFGIKGVTGFLSCKDYQSYYGTAAPLLPGTLIDVLISNQQAVAGVLQVSVALDAVAGGHLQSWDGLNMNNIMPGSLISCRVRQVLSDGVLVSFGGFFHGAIDHFHLGAPIPEQDWAKRYQVGTKLQARVLFVDPTNKRIGLSCLPHLLNMRLPTAVPQMGQIFEDAVVARVDPGLGLLLKLPMEPEAGVGFAHISNLSDGQLSKSDISKKFTVGSSVRGRVIGFRLVDGLCAMSLKESVLAQQVYSVKDLYPGQHLDVTVLDYTPAGLVVQITQNIKALVPKIHMTDTGVLADGAKLPSKLKPGKTLQARVLSVDPIHKRVQVTLKKGLVGSKLPVISDLRQAGAGMKVHGVVTGVAAFGVFVGFYGGLAGLLPKKHLDLLPGQEAGDVYTAGQLLRCQIASVDMRKGKLILKPSVKKSGEADEQAAAAAAAAAAAGPWGGLDVGSIVDGGVVQQVLQRTPEEGGGRIELTVTGPSGQPVLAHLPAAHLADHPGGVEALLTVIKPRITLPGPLLVLQQRRLNPNYKGDCWQQQQDDQQQQDAEASGQGTPIVLVTRKGLMLAAAQTLSPELPASPAEVSPGVVLPGYVASVSRDAVFVRFLGRCTGRAGLPQLADTFVTDPARHFSVGQSVLASVVAVEEGGVKFAVSLKPSVVGSSEGKFLAGLMSDLELAYQLQQSSESAADGDQESSDADDADESAPIDWSMFTPGTSVGASLHELKGYGAVMDLDVNPDVVGLVVPEHGGTADQIKEGSHVDACVLDVAKTTGIIELSLLPELTQLAKAAAAGKSNSSKKASKKAAAAVEEQQQHQLLLPAIGSEVQAMVQLIKDHYVVLSVLQQQQQQQGVKGKSAKAAKAAAAAANGPQQQQQHIAIGFLARGDLNSQGSAAKESQRFSRGQILAVIVAAAAATDNGGRLLLELAEPLAAAAAKGPGKAAAKDSAAVKPTTGGLVTATVVAVHELELEVVFGKSGSSAHIHVSELQERLTDLPPHNPLADYKVQQQMTAAWLGHVKGLGHKRGKDTQLSLRPAAIAAARQGGDKLKIPPVLCPSDLHPNLKVIGWVAGITSDALWLSLAPEVKGRVHVLESGDTPEQLAVPFEQRFSIGQAVAAVVLGLDPKHHTLDLSVRSDRVRRAITDPAAAAAAAQVPAAAAAGAVPAGGQLVPGRVVSVAGSGVVVQLGPKLQGAVALTDITDDWVSNALAGLSSGTYVRARVLTPPGAQPSPAKPSPALVDGKGRVLLSLRPKDGGLVAGSKQQQQGSAAAAAGLSKEGLLQLDKVKVGSKVKGYVRSVSNKGAFIILDRFHDARIKLSQLSDGFVEDPAAAFPVGTRVEGRVLTIEHTKPPQEQSSKGLAAAAAAAAAGEGLGSVRVEDDGVRVELSLRSESSGQLRTIADIQEGELTSGKVRRVEKYGVFVELSRSRVSGLAHISQVSQGFVKDLTSHYTPGQAVTVRVLSVDKESNKVSLSMKPELLVGDEDGQDGLANGHAEGSGVDGKGKKGVAQAADFDDEILDAMEVEESEEDADDSDLDIAEGESGSDDADSDVDMDDMDLSGEEGEGEGEESQEEGEDEQSASEGDGDPASASDSDADSDGEEPGGDVINTGLLGASAGDAAGDAADWGELQLTDGAAAAGGAAAYGTSGELSKSQKKKLKEQHEAEIRAAEKARLAGDTGPESAATYEQQLMAEPNSSYLWIKYMAFQLKLGEIDAARRIAERALSTIVMSEESEKFNVWVALLNLENAYGGTNAEEAVMTVFKRAVQYVEPKKLYIALLGILERSGRHELATDVWKTATKKFNTSCKVWMGAFESALQAANRAAEGDDDEAAGRSSNGRAAAGADAAAARNVLERALKSLPKHKHIKALTRAALAEFRIECAERGRSIFEGMLANYPKRIDIWNVYIDQEIKSGDTAHVRSLLARATSLSLPPKKMKVLFKRWLEFEQTHGSAADVAQVKLKAIEYMEQQAT